MPDIDEDVTCCDKTSKKAQRLGRVVWLVLKELLAYLVVYGVILAIYMQYKALYENLPDDQKDKIDGKIEDDRMTRFVNYLKQNVTYLSRDLTFLLGFYVTTTTRRWWEQVSGIPAPDNLAINVNAVVVDSQDGRSQNLKRKILNYVMASWLLCLRRCSLKLAVSFYYFGAKNV